jgi:biopolymer transport protein ExbD
MFYRYFRGRVDEFQLTHGTGRRAHGAAPDAVCRLRTQAERRARLAPHEVQPPPPEEPEINLIPFIDVLLVVLIFLMLSTTYSAASPSCRSTCRRPTPRSCVTGRPKSSSAVSADGRYAINRKPSTAAASSCWPRAGRAAAGRPRHGGHHLGRRAGGAPVGGQRAGRGPPRRAARLTFATQLPAGAAR